MLQLEENDQNFRLRGDKRGPKKRNKGYFKGNKPEWLCGTPEPYIFFQRGKKFWEGSLDVYSRLVPPCGKLPLCNITGL